MAKLDRTVAVSLLLHQGLIFCLLRSYALLTHTRKSESITLLIASMFHSRTCTAQSTCHVRSYIIMGKWTHPYGTQLPAPYLKTILTFSPAALPLVENSPKHGCTTAAFSFMAQDKRKVSLLLKVKPRKRTWGMEVTLKLNFSSASSSGRYIPRSTITDTHWKED
jgi:hypothetical protein